MKNVKTNKRTRKIKPMEKKLIAEAERGTLKRIAIYHRGAFSYEDIANQVVKCLNGKGYGVYIKSSSFDLGAHIGNGVVSPSVNVCPIDRPGMGFGPYGYMYGTTMVSVGFSEKSHPGLQQSLFEHFKGLEAST